MIHPTAIVHPKAELDSSVDVGPYAVIEEHVVLGAGCQVGPHVHLTGHTCVGEQTRFHTGCVIGDVPQDLRFKGGPTRVRIGARNVFREHVTVHRANSLTEDTLIGSDGLFMAHCHIGHNVQIGNAVIIANGALLGGHASVGDRAFISGNCLVHQFTRVGTLALMQGGSAISKDLPPFTVARGDNGLCGLNTVGLRRAGLPSETRLELRKLYHLLFRSRMKWREAVDAAQSSFSDPHALMLVSFLTSSKRGVLTDLRRSAVRGGAETDPEEG